jgi:hypothetical protein
MHYRPGKRVGAASWAHRAGAGDIIGWYAPQEPEPPRKQGAPSADNAPTSLTPQVSTVEMALFAAGTLLLIILRLLKHNFSHGSAINSGSASEKPPVVTDFPTSPVGGQTSRPSEASAGVSPEETPIHVRRVSAVVVASPRLVGPDEPRPGTGGYASQLSLRASYEAISSLPQTVDVWEAPTKPRLTTRSTDAAVKAALDGRDDFMKVLASRRSEIKVIRRIWAQKGACAALSHVGKLRNLSIAVDVLQAIAGVGFPKWPQFVDLDWLVELMPVVVSLLQSDYEEYVCCCCWDVVSLAGSCWVWRSYIVVGLNAIGSIIPGLQPLVAAMAEGQPPDRTRQR